MFEGLSEKLQATFKRLRGKGKLTEADVTEALREVRIALLEADVNFKVVKELIARIKERSVGQEVLESLTPGQHVIKIVHEEIIRLMGGSESKISISSKPPTIIMLVGLQGAGKTTHGAKLANMLKKQGKHPLLVACDIYRPAAIKQLEVLGEQIKVPVFSLGQENPVKIASESLVFSRKNGNDVVIIDTAGRLHINEELMDELSRIKGNVKPHEILLVVDAMTGQDAVNAADAFHQQLGLDGVILSKLDGDTRGGAALSVKAVTGCPIKFAGTGEKMDALEVFHPDRIASRILGMGDVLTLIERAQQNVDEKKARELEEKIRKQELTLDDYLDQIKQLRSMGPLSSVLEMLPGIGKQLKGVEIDEKEFYKAEAIICSMTADERRKPILIKDSRKKRIAKGSGTTVVDVGRLLKQYEQTKKMMKQLSGLPGMGGAVKGGTKKGKKGKKQGKKSFPKFPFQI
ncbi:MULTISPECIES: signal recognition particle protein [Dehalobacter]|uniref:Signal recognition particle protein n=1 Tax=Dehalobacter restrictus (strain DSM 9455 / PER-K23) TaxID=871738 RepID=A0ABM5P4U7_DEHRP|nr:MULTISPECIES: signal recognition particle protein [Dehalobacter]AHF09567.1 signal recognition particle protein Srp54 [Dehalobacter restrictus DSM 9455]MCG1026608.1 signal recognition particle protein [Dehalobacter sp.]MDJ0304397.1 signal recognition particle protein [Dehalobacter sp.]OCZ55013.1 signal recognition particle protein [Dehalobacter sp. TeCB1]